MIKNRIRFRQAWLFVSIFVLVTACWTPKKASHELEIVKAATEPVTISFWHTHNDEETSTLAAILADFQRAHPRISVQLQQVPFSDALNKYKTVAQAKSAPDLFRAEIAWTVDLASLGYLMALDGLMPEQEKRDYLPQAFAYNVYRNHIWGVPQVTDCLALLYNKRLLPEGPPRTTDELVSVAKRLTDPARKQYGFFFRGDPYWYLPFVWAFGGDLMDPQTLQVKIAEPPAVAALEYLVALRDKHHVVPAVVDFANDYENQQIGFKSGKYAMIINGPWSTADILSGDEFKDPANLGIARIPKGPGGYGSPVGGHNYVISSHTKHLLETWTVLAFLNQPENQARFALKNNLLPTRRSTYALPEIKASRIIQDFRQVLEVANNRPVIPKAGAIFDPLQPAFRAALQGEKSPQEALLTVKAAWENLLKE